MPTRPNILLITSHDLGRHLGCYGEHTVQSPRLDALAAQGTRLANAYCTAPQCSPSRASVATGRFPHSNGVMGLTHPPFLWDLHDTEQHMAQVLSKAGYATFMGGHMHETHKPAEQVGFDENLAFPGDCHQTADAAAAWLTHQATRLDKPFFLQMGFFEPHRGNPPTHFNHPADMAKEVRVPGFLHDDYEARDEFSLFQGAIRALDTAMGRVLDALDEAGLSDDTLVWFVADHGMPFPRAKCSLYDPGLEIATILRWPKGGLKAAGDVVEGLISNVDYFPTMLELAGVPLPERVRMEGRSFAGRLRGGELPARDEIFAELTNHEYQDPIRAIRTQRYKLLVNFSTAPSFMDSSQSWRPRCCTVVPPQPRLAYHRGPVELYDLEADPLEHHNVAHDPAHESVRRDLLSRLHQWMQETEDPLLHGIPTPPMHRLAMHALSSGEAVDHPKPLPQ